MDKDYFDYSSEINHQEAYGEDTGTKGGRPMLSHVIGLLKALIGILDIISENLGKHK